MTTREDLHRLYFVVRGRATILYAAHELLGFLNRNRGSSPPADLTWKYEALVATTFSLWRAIFLADALGGWEAVLQNAERFLEKLVRDNSIGYLDDWNNRAWSFVYYLTNARFRLKELADAWPEYRRRLTNSGKALEGPIVGANTIEAWEQHCEALQTAVVMLCDQRWESAQNEREGA